jgi:ATP-dependent RNA helicase DeaD
VPATREVPATRAPAASRGEADAEAGGPGDEAGGERGPRRGKIFFTLGEKDGADEAQVREAVAALAPGTALLGVEVRRSHSYLAVAPEVLEGAVAALNGKEWKGRPLTAEKARRRRR